MSSSSSNYSISNLSDTSVTKDLLIQSCNTLFLALEKANASGSYKLFGEADKIINSFILVNNAIERLPSNYKHVIPTKNISTDVSDFVKNDLLRKDLV